MTGSKRSSMLPFCRPSIDADDIAGVVEALESGWLTGGPKVEALEAAFKARFDAEAISVCSATAGLHLAVAALDLKAGDEVIVPSLTWPATSNVVELSGARTVFCEVDAETLCLDVADCARRITDRTRAIIPVHYAGQAVDLDALRALVEGRNIRIIEDAAHAIGTEYKGREIGASGELIVFSFHAIKNLSTGEGGMVIARGAELADRLRGLRFHGLSRSDAFRRAQGGGSPRYDVTYPGWKYNMAALQASLGLTQLSKLEAMNEKRKALAEHYLQGLARVPFARPLGLVPYESKHAWHLMVVRLELESLMIDRDAVMAAMREEKIGTGLHFLPVHLLTHYRETYGYKSGDLPVSEDAGERILSLPLFPGMNLSDVDDVVSALQRVLQGAAKATAKTGGAAS